MKEFNWQPGLKSSEDPRKYTCGYCGKFAPAQQHYLALPQDSSCTSPRYIFFCPNCDQPTYFASDYGPQYPGAPFGNEVPNVPIPVKQLYEEARKCMAIEAHSATVLVCRKILMHIAVSQGAPEGRTFLEYVDYLNEHGYITPKNKGWVDHIRKKGNDANHRIDPVFQVEAQNLVTFLEMLLRLIYEFPGKLPPSVP
jgi:hypothetical protein